jgi:signal transduction histidine kinase
MLALACAWVVVSMLLAFLALQFLFASNVERTVRTELSAGLMRLIAVIDPESPVPEISEPLPDAAYATPFSGRYWQIEALDTGEIARSRSLWDEVLATRAPAPQGGALFYALEGPEGQALAVLSREVEIAGDPPQRYRVTLARDRGTIDEAIARFNFESAVMLALLGVSIIGAAWLLVKLGLRPIRQLRSGVEAVRSGETERLEGSYPRELEPLVGEVNDLLAAREKSTEHARSRARDLAHGLKTPLAVLRSTAEGLREKGDTASAEALDDLSREMAEKIDYQLRLAALRIRSGAQVATSSLNASLIRTMTVLQKTHHGEVLHWAAELGADAVVDMQRQDLLELAGVVLENAAKWAESQVRITTGQDGLFAQVTIEDDGPGISETRIEEIGQPGRRLDESRSGTGFGLSIAKEIVRLNDGDIVFGRSALGGLSVALRLRLSNA